MIRVYCDDRSHEPKVATVGYLEDGAVLRYLGGRGGLPGRYLRQDDPAEMSQARLDSMSEHVLRRDDGQHFVLMCPLCGLNATMKPETLRQLHDGLVEAGASEVRLSALAASL